MRQASLIQLISAAACCWSFSHTASAITAADLQKAIRDGNTAFTARYRYEYVDQEYIAAKAGASTLKSRLTYKSADLAHFKMGIETDYVVSIGSQRYNSTENGNTRFPLVADPEGLDLNQAYLKYADDTLSITAGRQRILLNNQRHIGGVAWRQNEQTYDGIRVQYQHNKTINFDYSYIWNVKRIFGPEDGLQPADWRSHSHLLNVGYQISEHHALRGFGYLQEFNNDNGPESSVATYGIGYQGAFNKVSVSAETAQQTDFADNPQDYRAYYLSVGLSYSMQPIKLAAGYDILGSDSGIAGFRTPLATLHKFQGWTDKFLVTPDFGVKDLHFGISGKLGAVAMAATWHDFKDEDNNHNLGREIDLVADYNVNKYLSLQLKFARYHADRFSVDTTKAWFSVVVNL